MMNKQNNSQLISAALLILFAAATRLFPHYPNFTAMGAMAVFGGSMIKNKKLAFVLPLVALFLSDMSLQLLGITKGFYGGQLFVYAAFLIITALATFIRKPGVANITFAAVWSGLIFFAVSNFGIWAVGHGNVYPKTIAGLGACYAAAIPFYKNEFFGNFLLNSIYGNVFFSALLFGGYYVMARVRKPEHAVA
jgi:hypothetical protein